MSSPRNTRKILGSLDINSPRGKQSIAKNVTPKMERAKTLPATFDDAQSVAFQFEASVIRAESLGTGLEKLLERSRSLMAKLDADNQHYLDFKAKLDAESAELNKKEQAIREDMKSKIVKNHFYPKNKKNGTLQGAAFKLRCLSVLKELEDNNAKFLREHEITPAIESTIARLKSK